MQRIRGGKVWTWALALVASGAGVLYLIPTGEPLRANPSCDGAVACEAACGDGRAWACAELGDLERERGLEAKAKKLWEQACDGNSSRGCWQLYAGYDDGVFGIEKNPELAAKYVTKAYRLHRAECQRGWVGSCSALAVDHREGRGTRKNERAANAVYERLAAFYQRGCDAGDGDRCYSLGVLHEYGRHFPKSTDEANAYYTKACDHGDASGCREVNRHGDACDIGPAWNCYSAYDKAIDPAEKKKRLNQWAAGMFDLCMQGDASACYSAADAYEEEDPTYDIYKLVRKDHDKAKRAEEKQLDLNQRACEQGSGQACLSLAQLLTIADQLPRDITAAQEAYRRSCKLGSELACSSVKDPLPRAVALDVEGYHQCIVDTEAKVWCWGHSSYGEIGVKDQPFPQRPVHVAAVPAADSVLMGDNAACAHTKSDAWWCWGMRFGEPARVELPDDTRSIAVGFEEMCTLDGEGTVTCPRKTHEIGATALGAAGTNRCALVKDEMWCWGHVLGETVTDPVKVEDEDVIEMTISDDGFCARFADSSIRCRAYVLSADGIHEVKLAGVREVSGDGSIGCALQGDDLVCWDTHYKRLPKPKRVASGKGLRNLRAHDSNACVLKEDGEVWCWAIGYQLPAPVYFDRPRKQN